MTGYLVVMAIMALALTAVALASLGQGQKSQDQVERSGVTLVGDSRFSAIPNWPEFVLQARQSAVIYDWTSPNQMAVAIAEREIGDPPPAVLITAVGEAEQRSGIDRADFEVAYHTLLQRAGAIECNLICLLPSNLRLDEPWDAAVARICHSFNGTVVSDSEELSDALARNSSSHHAKPGAER